MSMILSCTYVHVLYCVLDPSVRFTGKYKQQINVEAPINNSFIRVDRRHEAVASCGIQEYFQLPDAVSDGEAMENFKSLESYQFFHAFKVDAVMFNEPASDMC